ncbi:MULTISPECIES: hypothetical protein [unclassified Pseudoalteromonas]|jgi:hypothetical protein|uniref:hypothetical protein n=1 Tax=unclassified Pseudoalteromonas TaxID=194690 RepID=UPI0006D5DB37|nr:MULTISPECIES: hypothetical protein [unclassified Pseudoalteromonas]KPV95157.1 hypothetical protein AN214_02809 [Pseudoalteromonas sp. P1-9]MCP4056501.1 hypothetical protein [Pseudoalteromonas sp.]MDC9502887.1 hypothetical protein [Pseudoalteromonas sp. Angola-18]|tara:strand:+ start:5587 stop:5889 length:303 start_codon:yes stop_codon:yes gene_type:complete
MWAVIKVDETLKFYNFQTEQYEVVSDIKFAHADELESINGISISFGGFTKTVLDHERSIKILLKHGFPLFMKKTDAREAAKAVNLTGYTYTQFEVSKIQL